MISKASVAFHFLVIFMEIKLMHIEKANNSSSGVLRSTSKGAARLESIEQLFQLSFKYATANLELLL